jgi:hypothetical protein
MGIFLFKIKEIMEVVMVTLLIILTIVLWMSVDD